MVDLLGMQTLTWEGDAFIAAACHILLVSPHVTEMMIFIFQQFSKSKKTQ